MKKGAPWLSAFSLGLFAFFQPHCAMAAAEFCPATIAGGFTQVDSQSYRFRLAAISPRSVSGFVRLQTEDGWYNAPFLNVPLKSSTKAYDDEGMTFSHSDFVSDDVVVHFPTPQHVLYGYVSQAQTTGETLLDWDKEGSVSCLPTARDPKAKAPQKTPQLPPLSKTALRLTAKAIDVTLTDKCEDAFEPVRLADSAKLQIPVLFAHDNFTAVPAGTTAVVVAVERDGSVVDAWLWETSGTPLLDKSALEQALKSTFKPGRAFCNNVPGYFLMRTVFKS